MTRHSGFGVAVWVSFVLAFMWRVALVVRYPGNYAFDGLQRWAGRDFLLVQDWLPGAQLLVHGCAGVGLSLLGLRVALSLAGAASIAVCTALAGRLGGRRAAWVAVPFALFGPHVAWTIVPYQEGIFLLVVQGALLFALYDRWFAADLLVGSSALVRYEGWPLVAAWMVWRQSGKSVVAGWGAAAWAITTVGFGAEAAHPSAVNIRDWDGMFDRFNMDLWLRDLAYAAARLVDSGAWVFLVGALVPAPRDRLRSLVWVWVGIQVSITLLWIVAIERAMSRMLVVPISLLAPLGAVGIAHIIGVASGEPRDHAQPRIVDHLGALVRWFGRPGVAALALLLLVTEGYDGWWRVKAETEATRAERAAVTLMRRCPECTWWVEPRTGFGPRGRHDGCELIQGLSDYRQGRDFYCATWIPLDEREEAAARRSSRVAWNEKQGSYMVWRKWENRTPRSSTADPAAPTPDASGEAGIKPPQVPDAEP